VQPILDSPQRRPPHRWAMAQVSYEIPEGLPDASTLHTAARRLVAIPEAMARDEAVQTIFKLVHGVLAAPEDAKKRKVRKSNEVFHRKVGRYEAGVDFLRGCGFMDIEEAESEEAQGPLLSMPVAYLSRLTDAHHTLAQAAHEAGMPVPPLPGGSFNPYQSNLQKTDSTRASKAPDAWKSEADRMREEVKRRQQEMREKVESAPPVDLRPTAFWLSAGRRLEDVVRETAEATEERSTDNALLQAQMASAKAAINGTNCKFESADKKRLAELRGKRVHEFCILRIICPDKSVLQVHFRSGDTGEHVVSQVAPLLAPQVRETSWYIYQSPPLKRLAPRERLAAAGFTPGANVYLGFDGNKPGPPYLEAALVSQLGPAPQEGQRGVNAPAGPTFSGEAMGWGVGQRLGGAPAAPAAAAPVAPAGTDSAPAAAGGPSTAMEE